MFFLMLWKTYALQKIQEEDEQEWWKKEEGIRRKENEEQEGQISQSKGG